MFSLLSGGGGIHKMWGQTLPGHLSGGGPNPRDKGGEGIEWRDLSDCTYSIEGAFFKDVYRHE
jgi:hypothetical protein